MTNISDAARKARLLKAVPPDGSSIGNKYLANKLGWKLDLYFKIRDELASEQKLLLGRGRGGSVRLAKPKPKPKPVSAKSSEKKQKARRKPERSLYPQFFSSLRLWADAQGWTNKIVQQTSDQGRRNTGGRFTRPDFLVIGIKKYEYTPGIVRDVETFEVKPVGAPIDAVFETAAHSRAATKSYLALQVAPDMPTEDQLARIESECQRFGVGLITFKDPGQYDQWTYLVDPIRSEPDPEFLEQFIRDQVKAQNQETIRKWLR